MMVSIKMPIPKNTERIRPMAVSSLIRVLVVIRSTSSNEIHPVRKAPPIRYAGFFVPDSIKPRQIPGNTACAIASPTNDFLFRNVNDPTIAELAVSRIEPITTNRMLGSLNEKNSVNEFISPALLPHHLIIKSEIRNQKLEIRNH